MIDVAVLVFVAVTSAALAAVSLRAVFCNARRLQAARTVAPLDGLDLSAATLAPVPDARGWPRAADVTDPAVAAAYASLADDRVVGGALVGEVLLVAGGAALGSVLVDAIGGGWSDAVKALSALCVAVFGIVYRTRAMRFWAVRAARYEDRYEVLTAPPAPVEPAPLPTWRDRVLGRLRRR